MKFSDIPQAGVTIICGRPQTGKTSLALELAGEALAENKNVLYFSLDGGREVMPSPIPDGLKIDTADSKEPDKLVDYILDKISASEGLDAVVVDYLQIIDHDGEKNALEKLAKLAKKKELKLLVLSQLNRTDEHVPVLENLQSMGINTDDAEAIVLVRKAQVNRGIQHETVWIKPQTNIFDFASKELSGSAFWAWVLNEACVDKQNPDAVAVGEAFLKEIKVDANDIDEVETELSVKDDQQKTCRVDIALLGAKTTESSKADSKKYPVAFIENKHFSTAELIKVIKQIDKYAKPFSSNPPQKVIMTWRHDTASQWYSIAEKKDICFLSLEKQVELIGGVKPKDCPIIQAYYDYISKLNIARTRRIDDILKKSFFDMSEDVWIEEDSLYEMMSRLTKGLKNEGEKPLRVYVKTGNNGDKFAQAAFCERGIDDEYYRAFFYRLDKDCNKDCKGQLGGYYLRLNCYTSKPKDKRDIVSRFEEADICKKDSSDSKLFYSMSGAKEGQETTILKVYILPNKNEKNKVGVETVSELNKKLKYVHNNKIFRLAKEAIETL